jgi:hypothetical protein
MPSGRCTRLWACNAHWIDTTSEDLLRYLAESITGARVLLVRTCRPGYQNPFGERTYFSRLVLHALTERESTQLAEAMLASSELPAELQTLIFHKAEGIPSLWRKRSNRSWRSGNSSGRTADTGSASRWRTSRCRKPSRTSSWRVSTAWKGRRKRPCS